MNYETLLKEHKLKVTPQRLAILSIMHASGHISIDDLFAEVVKSCPSISLATLYKNIHAMLESRLIKEIKAFGMKVKYEIAKEAHAHVVCYACGEFKDLTFDMSRVVADAAEESHYLIQDSSMIFSGLCHACH